MRESSLIHRLRPQLWGTKPVPCISLRFPKPQEHRTADFKSLFVPLLIPRPLLLAIILHAHPGLSSYLLAPRYLPPAQSCPALCPNPRTPGLLPQAPHPKSSLGPCLPGPHPTLPPQASSPFLPQPQYPQAFLHLPAILISW